MKSLLSLTLMSLLFSTLIGCTNDHKSYDYDTSNEEVDSIPHPPQVPQMSEEPQNQEYIKVYEYFPPEGVSFDELSDEGKALLYQLEQRVAPNCTIVDHETKTITITLPRNIEKHFDRSKINHYMSYFHDVERGKEQLNLNYLGFFQNRDNNIKIHIPEEMFPSNETNNRGNTYVGPTFNSSFTATSTSHAKIPDYAQYTFTTTANGQTPEAAKRRAYEMLLSKLTNHSNQLDNFNSYSRQEAALADQYLDRIDKLAVKVEYYGNKSFYNEMVEILNAWYSYNHPSFEDFEEDNEYNFLGSSDELAKKVKKTQTIIDRQLEYKCFIIDYKYASEKCFKKIAEELRYPDSNSARRIRSFISEWNRTK